MGAGSRRAGPRVEARRSPAAYSQDANALYLPIVQRRGMMSTRNIGSAATFGAVVLLIAVVNFLLPVTAAAQVTKDPVIHFNQAWSQDDRDWYYHFSQGSAVMSYDIFLNLEVAGGQELFRSDANSERYGLITQPAGSPFNPDGLPTSPAPMSGRKPTRWKTMTPATGGLEPVPDSDMLAA
jgi:hypothetical protein